MPAFSHPFRDVAPTNITAEMVVQPVSIKHGHRTADCGLGIKYGLGIKRGLENMDWV